MRNTQKKNKKDEPQANADDARMFPAESYRLASDGKTIARRVRLPDGETVETRLRSKTKVRGKADLGRHFDQLYLRRSRKPGEQRDREEVLGVDLFCGCGGLSLGAAEACRCLGKRFTAAVAVDTDEAALKVYRRNIPHKKVVSADVAALLDGELGSPVTDGEKRFKRGLGDVALLLAGPPCQGFSNLNNWTRRTDERNILYEKAARFVEVCAPTHVLIENVPMAIHGTEKPVDKAVALLERLDYHVDEGVVDLWRLGVPQKRKRHVVVASKEREIDIEDVVQRHEAKSQRTVKWAMGDLVDEKANGVFSRPADISDTNRRRVNYLHDRDIHNLPNEERPVCHQNEHHTYWAMYGRLWYDKPAQTITTGFNSPGQGRYVHPIRRRVITPHEAARLQSFPDFFDFSSATTRKALARMIGNAAPMRLAYVFALEFLA